jgi:hypothetical protein
MEPRGGLGGPYGRARFVRRADLDKWYPTPTMTDHGRHAINTDDDEQT